MNLKTRLLTVTFISGAMVMVFEIIGARILAPYIGTSFYVWTALIGVVLASLSLGYHIGGKWIDKKPQEDLLAYSLFAAGLSLLLVLFVKDVFLQWVIQHVKGIRASALISTIVLFVPPSLFFGSISPMVSKLILKDLDKAGKTMGSVFAYSSIGSLLGTFMAGFVLIPSFSLSVILAGLIVISISLSLYLFFIRKQWIGVVLSFAVVVILLFFISQDKKNDSYVYQGESSYNSIKIYPTIDYQSGDSILMMQLGKQRAGAMSLKGRPLPFNYLYYFRLAEYFTPQFESALMLGGAAYSFPKYFLEKYPSSTIDVIEIDEKLTEIAQEYFNLNVNHSRLHIFHEDARTYLNSSKKNYDVIYSDTFRNAVSLPYQLTTVEAVQKQYDMLKPGGVVLVNVIQAVEGKSSLFLQAELKTFQQVFPQVFLFADAGPEYRDRIQSTIIIALKSDQEYTLKSSDIGLDTLLSKVVNEPILLSQKVLTDDYAPVDYLAFRGL